MSKNTTRKITKHTLNNEMQMSIFDFEGFISDEKILLKRVIDRCRKNAEEFTMSTYVQKIYKELQTN